MLGAALFDTITGTVIETIPNSVIIDNIDITLATGTEASVATINLGLDKTQALGWREKYKKLDRSIAIYDHGNEVLYAGFIDKVIAEGSGDGGLELSIRLSDLAELLKMIKISKDKTFEGSTWQGVIKAIVADAFSQPNTPTVYMLDTTGAGTGKKLEAVAGSRGTAYSALIEQVKEASQGGYAEVSFQPFGAFWNGLIAVDWLATCEAALINLDTTVDVTNTEDVYDFTISSVSDSTFSRLVVQNAEGDSKTYTNPDGGTLLSDEVLYVDAVAADFDSIAAAYMQSEKLSSSESHEVGVKLPASSLRGTVGGAGVLPAAVGLGWSLPTRLRAVQLEYTISMDTVGTTPLTVPAIITFAPISNKTWVPPYRASVDSANQDYIDRNVNSGVGRDSYSGAHPGDYGGGPGSGGGDIPDGGGEIPNPGGSGTDGAPGMDDFPKDPAWWAGSEGMENPEDAKGRAKPLYGFDISEPRAQQVAYQSQGLWPGPNDDPRWRYGRGVYTGQSNDGKKVYWTYWSSSDPDAWPDLSDYQGYDEGVLLHDWFRSYQSGGPPPGSAYHELFLGVNDLKLVICEAELDKGEYKNARVVSTLVADKEIQAHMSLDLFMVGSMDDYEKFLDLGLDEAGLKKSASHGDRLDVKVAVRGIFATDDRIVILYETAIIIGGNNTIGSANVNTLRTITVKKTDNGDWESSLDIGSISNGGGARIRTSDDEGIQSGGWQFFAMPFRAGETWFGALGGTFTDQEVGDVAGIVFNAFSGNSIDPTSYNKIPPLPVYESIVRDNNGARGTLTVGRGTKNRGMSLYFYSGVSSAGNLAWELELVEGKPATVSPTAEWQLVSLHPDTISGHTQYVVGRLVTLHGVAAQAGVSALSGDQGIMALCYPTRDIPSYNGTLLSPTGSDTTKTNKTSMFDTLKFNMTEAGIPELDSSLPDYSNLSRIRNTFKPRGVYYHDGYVYSLPVGVERDAYTTTWPAMNYPFWWYSFKVTPRREPYDPGLASTHEDYWKYAYNDVPINPAARPAGWTPGPERYETEPKE